LAFWRTAGASTIQVALLVFSGCRAVTGSGSCDALCNQLVEGGFEEAWVWLHSVMVPGGLLTSACDSYSLGQALGSVILCVISWSTMSSAQGFRQGGGHHVRRLLRGAAFPVCVPVCSIPCVSLCCVLHVFIG
jgi:hypothetical protein